MEIHLVRVPQDFDVVNVGWKPAKWGEVPAFFSVHVDSYAIHHRTTAFHTLAPELLILSWSVVWTNSEEIQLTWSSLTKQSKPGETHN